MTFAHARSMGTAPANGYREAASSTRDIARSLRLRMTRSQVSVNKASATTWPSGGYHNRPLGPPPSGASSDRIARCISDGREPLRTIRADSEDDLATVAADVFRSTTTVRLGCCPIRWPATSTSSLSAATVWPRWSQTSHVSPSSSTRAAKWAALLRTASGSRSRGPSWVVMRMSNGSNEPGEVVGQRAARGVQDQPQRTQGVVVLGQPCEVHPVGLKASQRAVPARRPVHRVLEAVLNHLQLAARGQGGGVRFVELHSDHVLAAGIAQQEAAVGRKLSRANAMLPAFPAQIDDVAAGPAEPLGDGGERLRHDRPPVAGHEHDRRLGVGLLVAKVEAQRGGHFSRRRRAEVVEPNARGPLVVKQRHLSRPASGFDQPPHQPGRVRGGIVAVGTRSARRIEPCHSGKMHRPADRVRPARTTIFRRVFGWLAHGVTVADGTVWVKSRLGRSMTVVGCR